MNKITAICPIDGCGHHNTMNVEPGKAPSDGDLGTCAECSGLFLFVDLGGVIVTAGIDEGVKADRVPLDIFSMLLGGRQKGAPILIESTPSGNNWVKELFEMAIDRSDLSEELLGKCECSKCVEEMAKRAAAFRAHAPEGTEQEGPGEEDGPWAKGWTERSGEVPSVPDLMAEAAATFRERNALYGDSYKNFHEIMQVLFPNGLNLNTADEWRRFGVLFYLIGKVVRYCNNFATGGHVDSAHDSGVYSFMLEEVTRMGFKEKGL